MNTNIYSRRLRRVLPLRDRFEDILRGMSMSRGMRDTLPPIRQSEVDKPARRIRSRRGGRPAPSQETARLASTMGASRLAVPAAAVTAPLHTGKNQLYKPLPQDLTLDGRIVCLITSR
ncbi:hypothetical protein EVAR_75390_1 [Eumeta japonica]|uniref:Uncharacterized protein n=1 Tax=Eumeta variegata TaxID=151549 RepID=A0A4C1TL24_EUMVA|nr:hypothetical protein EVAR_75390_1 [Eumeta japonica]